MSNNPLAALGAIADDHWGLVTTTEAENVGVTRQQLSRWTRDGLLERIAHDVYRIPGAPKQEHEEIYAAWLALGGSTLPKAETGVPPVVASGITAAIIHGADNFVLDELEFVVPARVSTRPPNVKLRVRSIAPDDVLSVNGLPTTSPERTIADLIEQGIDRSLIADFTRNAADSGLITSSDSVIAGLTAPETKRKRKSSVARQDRNFIYQFFEIITALFPG